MLDFTNYQEPLVSLSKLELKELMLYLKNYQLQYKTQIGLSKDLSFAAEIEFSNAILKEVSQKVHHEFEYLDWYVHEDASVTKIINNNLIGGEISSDILHDNPQDWFNLLNIFNILNKAKAKITDSTAFQIHVGFQILKGNIKHLDRLIKTWCVFEDIIFRFGYGSLAYPRKDIMLYSAPILLTSKRLFTSKENLFSDLQAIKDSEFTKKRCLNLSHIFSLSPQECQNNTIEIRCFNGTLNPLVAQNEIYFILKLILYVTSDNYDEALINKMFNNLSPVELPTYSKFNLLKALQLCDMIFENSSEKIAFLKQYVKKEDFRLMR